jgi:hypothetical protein
MTDDRPQVPSMPTTGMFLLYRRCQRFATPRPCCHCPDATQVGVFAGSASVTATALVPTPAVWSSVSMPVFCQGLLKPSNWMAGTFASGAAGNNLA